jgi:Flp pilus assembly protein TadG
MRYTIDRKNEKGTSMAEFAVVALVFFMIIFGIIEFGRLLYTHNALTDAARRGARYAVLHEQDNPCVVNVVIYGETHVDPASPGCPAVAGAQPLINGLGAGNVVVTWAGASGFAYGMNLGSATVTIQNYDFNLSIPLLRRTLRMPAYRTTLPAENAGFVPAPIAGP